MLKGRKTYLTAGAIILGSAATWMDGSMTWQQSFMTGLQGLAMIFLRMGISNK